MERQKVIDEYMMLSQRLIEIKKEAQDVISQIERCKNKLQKMKDTEEQKLKEIKDGEQP